MDAAPGATPTIAEEIAADIEEPSPSSAGIGAQQQAILSLDCRKCHLKFKKREELANHLANFCKGSKYGDIDQLKRDLSHTSAGGVASESQSAPLSFEGVREFINSGIGAVGTITLADLRKQIRGDAAAMAEVKAEVLKGREKELLASLRDLKEKHSRIMVKRMEEESRVKEMIGDLDTQRSNEIRARIERERVKDALKRIDQANLQALEIEKRAEIDELIKEQELLKKKEAEALAEIDRLVKLIASNNANVISVPTEATTATRQGTIGERPLAPDDIRKKFATSGRQLGEDAAAMRLSRERMLKEREAIVAKLAEIANQKHAGTGRKPTDPATGVKLDDHQRRVLIDKLKTNQARESARLAALRDKLNLVRAEQERVLSSQDTEMNRLLEDSVADDPTDMGPAVFVPSSPVLGSGPVGLGNADQAMPTSSAMATAAEALSPTRTAMTAESFASGERDRPQPAHTSSPGLGPRQQRHALPEETYNADQPVATNDDDEVVDNEKQNLLEEIERLRTSLQAANSRSSPHRRTSSATSSASASPGPSASRRRPREALQAPMAPVDESVQVEDASLGSPRDYRGPASQGPGAGVNPLLVTQLQQQMAQTQLILQQHQTENTRLQQELGSIEMSNEVQRLDRQRRDFEATLRLMTTKLALQAGLASASEGAPGPDSVQRHRLGMTFPGDVVGDAARMPAPAVDLSTVPKDSELYRLEMEHRTRLLRVRYEREINAEQLELANVKQQSEMKAREIEEQRRHEQALADLRRQLEKQRLRQELAMQLPMSEFVVPKGDRPRYDPVVGFAILWDFIYGLEKTVASCRLTFQVLDGASPKRDAQQSVVMETQPDGPSLASNRLCMCGFVTHFPRLPPLRSLKVIVEVQGNVSGSSGTSVGWTLVELFNEDGVLLSGLWRAPLYTGPIRKEVAAASLHSSSMTQYRHPTAELFLRVIAPGYDADDNVRAGGDPNLVMGLYKQVGKAPASHAMSLDGPTAQQQPLQHLQRPQTDKQQMPTPRSRGTPATAVSEPAVQGATPGVEPVTGAGGPNTQLKTELGIVVRSCDLAGVTFARVRVSLYVKGVLLDNPAWKCTTPIAQVGASGAMGIIAWERSFMFVGCPNDGTLSFAVEVIKVPSARDEASVEFALTSDETVVAYTVVDAVRNETVNVGEFTVPMMTPPVIVPFRAGPSPLGDATLQVDVFAGAASCPQLKAVPLLADATTSSSAPWIKVDAGPPPDVAFEPGDGFDVYVDQCRFLPDNVTVTRAVLQVWTSDFGVGVGERALAVCSTGSQVQHPTFGIRSEYRARSFNPTCTLEVQVEAIEQGSKRLKLVGVAALNVFVTKGTRSQPTEAQTQEFSLNAGSFQLPLRVETVRPKDVFLASSYDKTPKIPCATVLVRIMPAAKSAELGEVMSTANVPESEWVSRKLVVPAAPYHSGTYDSTRCEPSKIEQRLYNIRSAQDAIHVDAILEQVDPGAKDLSQENEATVKAWIENQFTALSKKMGRNAPQRIDLKRFARYNPTTGLRIAIDAAYNVGDGALLPFVIYTISPPGTFYGEYPLTEDVQLTAQWDWDSLLKAPTFLGGYTLFRDVKYSEVAHCIIDVRLLKRANQPSIQPFGWTVLQLFDNDGYTNMGSFQLPLFKGLPDPDILEMMRAEPVANVIKREMSKEGNKKRKAAKKPLFEFLEPSSAMVRIADSLLEDLAPAKLSWRSTELLYAPWERRDKYEFDQEQASKGGIFGKKPQKLSSLMSTDDQSSVKAFEQATLKTIATELKILHLMR
ncbi:C2H2-type domain-containing protein [Plasmodiophora brassicae]